MRKTLLFATLFALPVLVAAGAVMAQDGADRPEMPARPERMCPTPEGPRPCGPDVHPLKWISDLRQEYRDKVAATVVGKATKVIIKNEKECEQDLVKCQIELKLNIENKGKQDIVGIRGDISYYDIFQNPVGGRRISLEEKIKSGKDYDFIDNQITNPSIRKLLVTRGLDRAKIVFTPNIIIFADGTRLQERDVMQAIRRGQGESPEQKSSPLDGLFEASVSVVSPAKDCQSVKNVPAGVNPCAARTEMKIKNKSSKDLDAFQGVAEVRNIFGDIVQYEPVTIDDALSSGKTTTVALRGITPPAEGSTQKFSFAPRTVILKDGTKIQ